MKTVMAHKKGQAKTQPADIDRLEISQPSMSASPGAVIGRNIADGGEFDSFSGTDDRTGTLAKQSRKKLVVYESSASSAIWSTGCNHKR